MSLRIIYGRAGSGKSRFCLNEINNRLKDINAGSLLLIVPEQFSLQAEKNLIKTLGAEGAMKAEVLSFRRIAHRILGEVGGLARPHINASGRSILIFRIIDELKGDLKFFSKAATQRGFVNTLLKTISEMKRYNVSPDALINICNNSKENKKSEVSNVTPGLMDQALKSKLEEISLVYFEFEKRLHEKYIDSDDDLTELSKKLHKSKQFDGAEIFIDEFSGFTPQEYSVIREFLKKGFKVNVSLCTDTLPEYSDIDSIDLFSPTKITASKLIKIATEENVKIVKSINLSLLNQKNSSEPLVGLLSATTTESLTTMSTGSPPGLPPGLPIESQTGLPTTTSTGYPTGSPRFRNSGELSHLEKQLFSFPPLQYQERTREISILAAANIHKEVEDTARNIIGLCRDKGMRYRDIAVVSRNLEIYEKQISTIFTEYGIPFFIDAKKDINRHPLISLILSVFEILINNWSYEGVFRYLKTGFTNINRDEVDIIENYVLACGTRGGKWTQDEPWKYIPGADFSERGITEYEENRLIKLNEIRNQIVKPLLDFRLNIKGKRKCKEICSALYDFLCSINVPERIEERIEFFRKSDRLDLANEYGQVWNIIIEVLDQVFEAGGQEEISLKKFSNLLEIGFSEYRIGLIPPSLDQVLIGSAERSKSHEICAMFVLGVNDGVFPAALNSEGILSDKERESLNSLGIELAQDSRTRAFEEQFLVYTTLTNAERYLRLSFAASDNEGKALRPSVIISRIKKVFPKIKEESNIIFNDTDIANLDLISVPAPTFNEMVGSIRHQVEGFTVNPIWWDVYNWYFHNEEWQSKCLKAIDGISYTNKAEQISASKARMLYAGNMNTINTSISRLEQFMSCPFSFYIQYGLKAKDRKVYKLETPDIGTFMHTVIDRFSKSLSDKGKSFRKLDMDWCTQEVSDIVDDMLSNSPGFILGSSDRFKYLTSRLKRIINRSIWVIAEHIGRSGFEPVGYEIIFGNGGDYPPIVIDLPSGYKLQLSGRIDRMDILGKDGDSYFRIVDYKSGNKEFRLSDVYYGLQIQLVAYLNAILSAENVIGNTVSPGGIFYLKLDDPIIKCERDTKEEDIETEILKKFKMRGLLLDDINIVKEMDNEIDGNSAVIPARINKDGKLGKSSAASHEQFEALQEYVRSLLSMVGAEIINGVVSISPYKKKSFSACSYCKYLSICQFDTKMKENTYRVLRDIKDDEVWGKFKGGAK